MSRDRDPWEDSPDITWGCYAVLWLVALVVLLGFLAAYLRG